MLKDIKHTIKQSAVYGLSRISTKLIAFVLLPLYSLNFSLAEYGVIVRIEALWQILWIVFLFGLEPGIISWYTKFQEESKKRIFLFSVSLFLFVTNIIYTIIFYYTSGFFSLMIFDTLNYSTLIFYASLIGSFETFIFVVFLLLRIKERAFLYSMFSILITLINLAVQLYFLLYTDMKLEGIFIAKILSPALVLLLLFPYFAKYLKIGFDPETMKTLIRYSLPLMIAGVVGTLLNQSDRYILGYLTDSREVGLYGFGYNICGILNFFIIAPFALAFNVLAWKKYKDANAKRFFTKSVTYLFFAIIYLALILSLATPILIKIFTLNQDYWLAKDIVPWIALSIPFYGISYIGFFSFYVAQKTVYMLWVYLTALLVNIILNFILIPHYQMYGAAVSNFLSFLILCLMNYFLSRNSYFFGYEWKKIFFMILIYILLVFPFFYFSFENTFTEYILKLAAVIAFPLLLYPLNFYELIEINSIRGFFNKYLRTNFKDKN
ncbi:MAG: polysaccharide biosynthesis C-terminal domain-containing protein [Bacteroidota bacterium]|nr:polysaccharide biosynthesis C-terminal domain-containing protein [Bacteroidota bacterium]